MTYKELRTINDRINKRMLRMERTKGSEFDETETRTYKALQEMAKKVGTKKRATTGGYRFKTSGFDKLEKTDKALYDEIVKTALKADKYQTPKKAIKEQKRRFKKAGFDFSEQDILDFNEIFRGSAWERLSDWFVSTQKVEIMKANDWDNGTVNDKLDQYLGAVTVVNKDDLRDFLMGYIDLEEIIEGEAIKQEEEEFRRWRESKMSGSIE